MLLSVITCSYNPDLDIFNKLLTALKKQTLPLQNWEFIIIDNNSNFEIEKKIKVEWHPNVRIVKEPKPGLLNARITGVHLAASPLVVFVDDDNLLREDFLSVAYNFHITHPDVGSFGGRSIPKFEIPPPEWFCDSNVNLGCQDHGDHLILSDFSASGWRITKYPGFAPIGTGMVITRHAFLSYLEDVGNDQERLKLGRTGESLYSGEDNDIILTIIGKGFEIAYVPELIVDHVIPKKRLTVDYLSAMAYNSSRSWIILLAAHKICPWRPIDRWSVPFRKIKACLTYRAWGNPANYIRWKAACGTFESLAQINDKT